MWLLSLVSGNNYILFTALDLFIYRGERRMWFSLVLIQYTVYWRNWQALEDITEKARELDFNNLILGPLLYTIFESGLARTVMKRGVRHRCILVDNIYSAAHHSHGRSKVWKVNGMCMYMRCVCEARRNIYL